MNTSEQANLTSLRAGLLVRLCFEARTIAHIAHFLTKNEAQHEALNTFYEDIVPLTDKFAECYMGKYGPLTKFPLVQMPMDTPAVFFKSVRTWIETNRKSFEDESLQSLVDDILNAFNQLLYKLENLS